MTAEGRSGARVEAAGVRLRSDRALRVILSAISGASTANVNGSSSQRQAEGEAEEAEVHDMGGGDCADVGTGSTPTQGYGSEVRLIGQERIALGLPFRDALSRFSHGDAAGPGPGPNCDAFVHNKRVVEREHGGIAAHLRVG
jgi:hypothetical protein